MKNQRKQSRQRRLYLAGSTMTIAHWVKKVIPYKTRSRVTCTSRCNSSSKSRGTWDHSLFQLVVDSVSDWLQLSMGIHQSRFLRVTRMRWGRKKRIRSSMTLSWINLMKKWERKKTMKKLIELRWGLLRFVVTLTKFFASTSSMEWFLSLTGHSFTILWKQKIIESFASLKSTLRTRMRMISLRT